MVTISMLTSLAVLAVFVILAVSFIVFVIVFLMYEKVQFIEDDVKRLLKENKHEVA